MRTKAIKFMKEYSIKKDTNHTSNIKENSSRKNSEESNDDTSESVLYDSLIRFLSAWTCPREHDFRKCILLLGASLESEGLWRHAHALEAGLQQLADRGYAFPARREIKPGYVREADTLRHEVLSFFISTKYYFINTESLIFAKN